ncbi:very short patch repair endonuclease [Nitrospina watsonii]|nr:DNA mismatch endonuclease Vsr [Nitrospina watsonii]
MIDTFSAQKRSWIMARVKGRDTKPELLVRSLAHRLGFRFRLYRQDLPGRPDLTFPRHEKIILVNGCFWHGHKCPRGKRKPQQNNSYWKEKIEKNRKRDRQNIGKLVKLGWKVLVVWECECKEQDKLAIKIQTFIAGENEKK